MPVILFASLAYGLDAHGPALASSAGDVPAEPLVTWVPDLGKGFSFSLSSEVATGLLVRERILDDLVIPENLLGTMWGVGVGVRAPISNRFAMSVYAPFFPYSTGLEGQNTFAFGDFHLSVPVGIVLPQGRRPGVGLVPDLLLPTGNADLFLGANQLGLGLMAYMGQPRGRVPWSLNLGPSFLKDERAEEADDADLDRRLSFRVSGSVGWSPLPWLGVGGELWVSPSLLGVRDIPGEALLRAGVTLPSGFSATLAGGRAITGAPGTAAMRGYLRLGWARPAPPDPTVDVPVVESPPEKPAPNVLVFVHDENGNPLDATFEATSDTHPTVRTSVGSDGIESLSLPPGSWKVQLSAPGRESQIRTLRITEDRFVPAQVEAVLWPQSGEEQVRLSLLDLGGEPVEGARVQIDGQDRGTTSSGGTLELQGIEGGTRTIQVNAPEFLPVSSLSVPTSSEAATLYLKRPPGSVRVLVQDEQGIVEEAMVQAFPSGAAGSSPGEAVGEDGLVSLVLEPGLWTVVVSADKYGIQEREVLLAPDTPFQELVVVLSKTPSGDAELVVRVIDPAGAPVVGASVWMDGHSLGTTGSAGVLKVAGLVPGARTISVTGPRFREMEPMQVDLPPGSREFPVILAWKPGSVQVLCRGPEGAELDARVRWMGADVQESSLGPDGRAFYTLEPGEWHLILSSPTFGLQERDIVVEPDDVELIEIDAGLLREEGDARLLVEVLDPLGQQVPEAMVWVDGLLAGTTGTNGELVLSGLAAGSHRLRVAGTWFVDTERTFNLKESGSERVVLDWAGAPVWVEAQADQKPVSDALVRLFGRDITDPYPVNTDGRRMFTVEPGPWTVVASSASAGLGERDIEVLPIKGGGESGIQREVVELVQPPMARADLLIEVVDSLGRPVSGATVWVGERQWVAEVGVVVASELAVAPVSVRVNVPGYAPWEEDKLALVQGSQSRRVVLVALPRAVSVEVRDGRGRVVGDVPVRFSLGKRSVTAQSGEAVVLVPGVWRVLVNGGEALGVWQGEVEVLPGVEESVVPVVLKGSRVEVQANELVIREQVFFEFDRAVLDPRSDAVLAEVAATLALHPEIVRVEVQGHTDDRGGSEYNLELSRRRAEAVRDRLVRLGVDPSRLVATGYGSSQPIGSNRSEAGRQKNRRVEFEILPVEATLMPPEAPSPGAPL